MRDNYDKWGQSKIEFFNFNYNLNHYLENNFTLTLIILGLGPAMPKPGMFPLSADEPR